MSIKICLVTTLPITSAGGIENIARNIMTFLSKKKDIKITNLYNYTNYSNNISSLFNTYKLSKKIKKNEFDIIHTFDHTAYFYSKDSKPIIHTICSNWDFYFRMMPTTIKNKILRWFLIRMEKKCINNADFCTSDSSFLLNWINKYYDVNITDSKVIYSGVDTNKFKPKKKYESKIKYGLWVGTNPELKGLNIAIQAIKNIKNVNLLVAGVNGKNDEKTKYLGHINPEYMPNIYSQADFLLFPSKFDTVPIVSLEAMSSGLPVIVSTNANVEIMKNGKEGFIIPSFNPIDYRNAIIKLLENDNLIKMGRYARKTAKKYDWQTQSEKYYRVYKNVLNQKF